MLTRIKCSCGQAARQDQAREAAQENCWQAARADRRVRESYLHRQASGVIFIMPHAVRLRNRSSAFKLPSRRKALHSHSQVSVGCSDCLNRWYLHTHLCDVQTLFQRCQLHRSASSPCTNQSSDVVVVCVHSCTGICAPRRARVALSECPRSCASTCAVELTARCVMLMFASVCMYMHSQHSALALRVG